MTRDTAVTTIMRRLGNRTGIETQVIAELQARQVLLERASELPWFLLTRKTNYATVANTQTVDLVGGFLREFEDVPLYLVDSDGADQALDKDDFDVMHRSGNFLTPGQPTNYALIGDKFYLFPTPNGVYTLKSFYYAAAAELTSDIENAWLKYYPELLIADAGLQLARFFRDQGAQAMFKEARSEAYTLMLVENEARKQAARNAFLGG